MGQLEDMALFVRIIEAGGIGKASEQLGLAKSAVRRRLADLEYRLDTQLLMRTTRRSSLTDAGRNYYQRSRDILDDVATINAETRQDNKSLQGTLKVTAPLSFGLLHMTPVIDKFAKQHPDLSIELDFSDRQVDLVEEGYELAIRIANLKDSSLHARRITTIQHQLVASPDYLNKYGGVRKVTDLKRHYFLHYGLTGQGTVKITAPDAKEHLLYLNTKIKANNGDFLRDMAIQGHGMTILPTFIVYQAILDGDLVPVLRDHTFPILHAYAVYSHTRYLPQRARLLMDFIAQSFGDSPYWDQQLNMMS